MTATPPPAAPTTTKKLKGYVDIEVGDTEFRLDGRIGPVIEVGWREGVDGQEAKQLGLIEDVMVKVGTALTGVTQGKDEAGSFANRLDATLKELSGTPGLGPVIEALLKLEIWVTALYIRAETPKEDKNGTYKVTNASFGFRAVFTTDVGLGPVKLKGFGVLFEYTLNGDGTTAAKANATPETK